MGISNKEIPPSRHLGAIGNNITPGLKWTFDGIERDMVDEIAGVQNINSPVMLVS